MLDKFTKLTPELYGYVLEHRSERDPVLAALIEETGKLGGWSMMQIAPEQGAFLTMLARIMNAQSAIEVGTFTGYSAISIARGLAPGGRLLCCDVSEEWTAIARDFWQRAGVAERIRLEIAPATDTLRALPEGETVDLAFIDADKVNYKTYYEEILKRLKPNGLIVFDNVLWGGSVVDEQNQKDDTVAIRALNDFVASDPRVECVMIPVADGLLLTRKRAAGETR
ncbi:class I SAM-dependent methyltransferase [Candidatus Binatia bacterium]|nr:class I SAM-dependent methyltransferase [Candidatus Binatia bacterium]